MNDAAVYTVNTQPIPVPTSAAGLLSISNSRLDVNVKSEILRAETDRLLKCIPILHS